MKNKDIKYLIRNILSEAFNENWKVAYNKWKRENVTLRGMKQIGQENGSGAMLGSGLYMAPLSNKALAKQYGDVHYVLNGKPKNPLVFKDLNLWEMWEQNFIYKTLGFKSRTDFNNKTDIATEIQKLGHDGVVIKGREMVNYSPPENLMYFQNDNQLIDYYERNVENQQTDLFLKEDVNVEVCKNCFHSWQIKNSDKDKHLCHVCGYDNNAGEFKIKELKQWQKNYYSKLNEGRVKNDLKSVLNSDEAYAILDASPASGTMWTEGGCAILAFALNKAYGYPVYVIYDNTLGQVDHFVAKAPDGNFVDYYGPQKYILRNFKNREGLQDRKMVLKPYEPGINISDIVIDEKASSELAKLIKSNIIKESELGSREDVEDFGIKHLKVIPHFDILTQVAQDWGRDSSLYNALQYYFLRGDLSVSKLAGILKDYDVFDNYKHFLNLNEESNSSDIAIKDIDSSYIDQTYKLVGNQFGTNGTPSIGLFDGGKLIGAVLLDEDYLPYEYRFDIVINKRYRNKGYSSLLIKALIDKFKKDTEADQLAATVVNKKLLNTLENKFGFWIGEYEGDAFAWLTKKDVSLNEETQQGFDKLEQKLLSLGGEKVAHTFEEDLDKILTRGQVFDGKKSQVVKMRDSKCHTNSSCFWKNYSDEHGTDEVKIVTGWALSPDDKTWRQHTWVYLPGKNKVIETTVKREKYFGFILDDDEAEDFYWMNW